MDHVSAIDAMGDSSHVADANYMSGGHDTTSTAAPPSPKKKDRTMLYIFGGAAAAFAAYAAYSSMGAKHAHQAAQFAPPPAAVQPVAPLVPAAPAAPASPTPAPTVSTVPNPLAAAPQATPTTPAAPTVSAPKPEKVKPAKVASDNAAVPQTTVKVVSPTASETGSQAPTQSGTDGQLSTRMDKIEHRVGRIEVAVNRIERAIHPAGRVKYHRKWVHGKHKHLGKHHHEKVAHKDAAVTATVDSAIKVQAVTPGRVWIMDKKGETHTYTLGDKLPNGAEIKGINADSGVIETSKGNIK